MIPHFFAAVLVSGLVSGNCHCFRSRFELRYIPRKEVVLCQCKPKLKD